MFPLYINVWFSNFFLVMISTLNQLQIFNSGWISLTSLGSSFWSHLCLQMPEPLHCLHYNFYPQDLLCIAYTSGQNYLQKFSQSRKSWRIKLRLPMLVMLKQNLRTSRQVYFQIAHHHNPRIDPERHPKMFLLSTMNLNSVKLQRFVQSEVFVTNVTFK